MHEIQDKQRPFGNKHVNSTKFLKIFHIFIQINFDHHHITSVLWSVLGLQMGTNIETYRKGQNRASNIRCFVNDRKS